MHIQESGAPCHFGAPDKGKKEANLYFNSSSLSTKRKPSVSAVSGNAGPTIPQLNFIQWRDLP